MKIKVTICESNLIEDPEEIQAILERVSRIVSNAHQRKGSAINGETH